MKLVPCNLYIKIYHGAATRIKTIMPQSIGIFLMAFKPFVNKRYKNILPNDRIIAIGPLVRVANASDAADKIKNRVLSFKYP